MSGSAPEAAGPSEPRSFPAQDPPEHQSPSLHATARTRISGTWVGIVVAAVVLVLLLVFILQNTRSVKVSYLGASGQIPLGVVLLMATIGGVLLSGVVASLRIIQIRRRLGGNRRRSARSPIPIVDSPLADQDVGTSPQDDPAAGTARP